MKIEHVGENSTHAGMAQQLQHMCAWTSRVAAGANVPDRMLSAAESESIVLGELPGGRDP
jgi:hypothetical protein